MECLIDTYSETGRPVGFTAIQKCVGERHGRAPRAGQEGP